MYRQNNLQIVLLDEMVKEKIPVTLFLMNGFQLRGVITGHDDSLVVIVTDGKQQVVYKHGISTIAPIRPLQSAQP